MTEQDKRNIEAVLLLYSDEDGNYDEAERRNIAPDIFYHVPGHNPLSGDFRGFEVYTNKRVQGYTPFKRTAFTLEDVMVNGNFVMTIFRLQRERQSDGETIEFRGGGVFRLNDEGKVVEGWGFTNNQDALDEFYSELPEPR